MTRAMGNTLTSQQLPKRAWFGALDVHELSTTRGQALTSATVVLLITIGDGLWIARDQYNCMPMTSS